MLLPKPRYSLIPNDDGSMETTRSSRNAILLTMLFTMTAVSTVCKCMTPVGFAFIDSMSTPVEEAVVVDDTIADPNPNAKSPKIAWLMSFPNSGTSFTMRLVGRATNKTVASNYGYECDSDEKGANFPVHPDYPNGPFLLRPSVRDVPETYIMTKTHCGGRCSDCGPNDYIETKQSFLRMCLQGNIIAPEKEGKKRQKVIVHYNEALAQRAIHLIRDPFNNAVSNFHLEQNEKKKQGRIDWLQKYTNDEYGFKLWCSDLDQKYRDEERMSRLIPEPVLRMFEDIPCHAHFYRFAQWHNLAIQVTDDLKLPTIYMWYENYETDFNLSVSQLMSFLKAPLLGEIAPFVGGKQYSEYFNISTKIKTMEMVKYLTNRAAWDLIKRYAP